MNKHIVHDTLNAHCLCMLLWAVNGLACNMRHSRSHHIHCVGRTINVNIGLSNLTVTKLRYLPSVHTAMHIPSATSDPMATVMARYARLYPLTNGIWVITSPLA